MMHGRKNIKLYKSHSRIVTCVIGIVVDFNYVYPSYVYPPYVYDKF